MKFGVIGYGYWGPNIVRNLMSLEGSEVLAIAEISPHARLRAQKAHPGVQVVASASEVICSPEIDAIAVVSPVWTHYELTKTALENGKHVFVEKPFTSTSAQGEELIDLAAQKNLKIMVDHTFLFTGAVKKIKQLVDDGALGNLYYYDSTRVNLGLFQHDCNVLWDLAPHDLSIMDYLLKGDPEAIVATGQGHLNGHEDVAFMTLYFPEKVIAHINVNWLVAGEGEDDPHRRREAHAGVERSRSRRKAQGLRQGREDQQQGRRLRTAGQLPLRRYVGSAVGAGRGACGTSCLTLSIVFQQGRSRSTTVALVCVWCECSKRPMNRSTRREHWFIYEHL